MKIREMLNRRTDLSTFVVHLTSQHGGNSARQNLRLILSQQRIRALTAMGAASEQFEPRSPGWNSQRVASFTESPLEQLHSFFVDFEESRLHRFEPYGLAFTKMQARRSGVLPVWYTDVTWGATWRVKYIWNLVEREKALGTFVGSDIAQIAPFVETMGYVRTGRKEFWWEREWRHLGDYSFQYRDVGLGLCPETRIDEFERFMNGIAQRRDPSAATVRFIDPRWGLEEIIGRLAEVSPADLSPFPG